MRVVSSVDAIGVMQVLPSTAKVLSRQYGRSLNLLKAQDNITAGVLLLRQLQRSTGSTNMTLAGYYQGLGSISRKGLLPQTHSYIRSIEILRKRFARRLSAPRVAYARARLDSPVVDAPTRPTADPLVGRLLDGRYRLEETVARGGMATVYTATDTRLDRVVAVKVMHRALADDPEFVARFTREAKAAARLSSPEVVAVHDQGTDPDSGLAYLVMEYVRGGTLRDLVRDQGAQSPARAVALVQPVLRALAAAHAAGLVHRDVKPENVLLGDDGRIKVADFGLARAIEASTLTATTGLLLGTAAYLVPRAGRSTARPTPAATSTPPGSCCGSCSRAPRRTPVTAPSRWPTGTCTRTSRRPRAWSPASRAASTSWSCASPGASRRRARSTPAPSWPSSTRWPPTCRWPCRRSRPWSCRCRRDRPLPRPVPRPVARRPVRRRTRVLRLLALLVALVAVAGGAFLLVGRQPAIPSVRRAAARRRHARPRPGRASASSPARRASTRRCRRGSWWTRTPTAARAGRRARPSR